MRVFVPRSRDVCRRIAAARSASGLTHEGMARSLTACTGLEVSTRDIRRFERSSIPWQLLDEIARLTETSPTWLLYGEAPPHDPQVEASPAVGTPGGDAAEQGDWRPSRARTAVGLLLGFAVGVAIAASTGSGPAAAAAAIGVALLPFLRGHGR